MILSSEIISSVAGCGILFYAGHMENQNAEMVTMAEFARRCGINRETVARHIRKAPRGGVQLQATKAANGHDWLIHSSQASLPQYVQRRPAVLTAPEAARMATAGLSRVYMQRYAAALQQLDEAVEDFLAWRHLISLDWSKGITTEQVEAWSRDTDPLVDEIGTACRRFGIASELVAARDELEAEVLKAGQGAE